MSTSRIRTADDFESIRYQEVGDTSYPNGIVVLSDKYVESGRWVEIWELVWSENDGKDLFSYFYEVPATEYQAGSESDFDASGIAEVVAEEVTVIKYTRVPKIMAEKRDNKSIASDVPFDFFL